MSARPRPAEAAGERLDALAFAFPRRPGGVAPFLAALATILRHPRRAGAILMARLLGKRLRARQALAALIGIDHDLSLPARNRPEIEPQSALAHAGIDLASPGEAADFRGSAAPVILFTGPDQSLVHGAGDQIAAAFRADPDLLALYGDALLEPRRDGPLLPILRPSFDRDYLRSVDVAGPVVAFRRAGLETLGGAPAAGAEAFDLLLRIADRFGDAAIRHLPRVLSLWQPWRGSGSRDTGTREARFAAVRRSLERDGSGVARLDPGGVITILYPLPEPPPLVSLIVPTRDRLDLLAPCLDSLLHRTDWPAKEILICDNDSREPGTRAYLDRIAAKGEARILPCPGPFDFAAMNNAAATAARGRVLAFVNNDIEAFDPDWLDRMVRVALRPGIGAVGAKLIDGEGRIQHGGIVLGTGGLVTHAHRHFPGDAIGHLSALRATHAVSAVTAACLVIEADKFRSIGGFDAATFAVDFNDVDLCLRLAAAGFRNLIVPAAVLVHREAASRRWTPAARARHEAEIAALQERWGPLLAQDPHYHPGFDPALSTHARLRRGWTGSEPALPR